MNELDKHPLDIFVASLQAGSLKHFKILFEAYYPKVLSYVRKFAVDEQTAEDLSQNVFINLWLNIDSLIPSATKIERYIFTIAKHEVLNWFRSRKTHEKFREQVSMELARECKLDEAIDAKRCLRLIDMVIEQMPEVRRRIFIMSRFQHMSNEGIAQKLGISKRTVEKQISNSLKQIRSSLASICSILPILIAGLS